MRIWGTVGRRVAKVRAACQGNFAAHQALARLPTMLPSMKLPARPHYAERRTYAQNKKPVDLENRL